MAKQSSTRSRSESTPEKVRLSESKEKKKPWKKWGPYLSERQWGTVREDYSESGDAWNYFTHDQARSRTYRWGEDGIAGISDSEQRLCFALALWNGNDPILKERLFGLTNSESNHGEDVKEYYFYLDSTPTHSYMKHLYKYPQGAFPYDNLVITSRGKSRQEFEYELMDTGIFNESRYFDVFTEYAKESPEDILIRITAHNRGPEEAELYLIPTLWFRNFWSWQPEATRPTLSKGSAARTGGVIRATDEKLGELYLYCEGKCSLVFTENETNSERLFKKPNETPYVKDGFHNYVIHGEKMAVNPAGSGTKAGAIYQLKIGAGQSTSIRLRLSAVGPRALSKSYGEGGAFGDHFDDVFQTRQREADSFYKQVVPSSLNADQANVMRQALAGMMWSKQFYFYDVSRWLAERGSDPRKADRKPGPRNDQWLHLYNGDIISMPDKWEYPWYAAWDLAFHVLALSIVDPDFGREQLKLMVSSHYMHPNGQIPAYEWNFSDVNPPVHAWSTIFSYRLQALQTDDDIAWLKTIFKKLLLNFTWWVNRKDRSGRNVFEGGFLGLDNIGVFDRSAPLPTGGYLEQADGTAWMALFSQNMLEISAALALDDPTYMEMALKFCEHFLWIASSMVQVGGDDVGMWDEEDGFFYDVLRLPDGGAQRLKVRSMVGLLPLCAVTTFEGELLKKRPELNESFNWFLERRDDLWEHIHDPSKTGQGGRRMTSVLNEGRLRRVLEKMLDENEFFGDYGLRSVSRFHLENPYQVKVDGQQFSVAYLPGESDTGMFGGNSNWRGPVWMPVNVLIIRALLQYFTFYGNSFRIECPTGSGKMMNLYEVAEELARRLSAIFLRNGEGKRPVYGGAAVFQEDPHWRDLVLFYEYFHGDNGAGLGASHQTGWTGLVARTLHFFATTTQEQLLGAGKSVLAANED